MLVILAFFARNLIQREQKRADNLDDDNKRLNILIQDKIIPALINATNAIQASQSLLQALQRQRELDDKLAEREEERRRREEERKRGDSDAA